MTTKTTITSTYDLNNFYLSYELLTLINNNTIEQSQFMYFGVFGLFFDSFPPFLVYDLITWKEHMSSSLTLRTAAQFSNIPQ